VLHFNMKTIRGYRCIAQLRMAAFLHKKAASTGLSPGKFCAQVRDERCTLM
jgi:hypothetical protein